MSGAWKVAYADFVTAMMAFFLLMWILGMASKETLQGLAGYFKADAKYQSDVNSPNAVIGNNPIIQNIKYGDPEKFNEEEKSNLAILKSLENVVMKDSIDSPVSGLTADNTGVLLDMTPALAFKPGTVELTDQAKKVLNGVVATMNKHKAFLIIKGYADSSEKNSPLMQTYHSLWGVASARANAVVTYLQEHGVNEVRMRTVSYGDSRPKVPPTIQNHALQNSRVELLFHRPEVMSNIVNY